MAKGPQLLDADDLLEPIGRSKEGYLIFVLKDRQRTRAIEHAITYSRYREVFNVEMDDGSKVDEGYVIPV